MPITDRHRELIQSVLEGIAPPADLAELERLLIADPEVAAAFAEAARLDALLDRHFRREYKIAEVANLLGEPDETVSEPKSGERAAHPETTFVARCAVPEEARRSVLVRSRRRLAGAWKWIVALLLVVGLGTVLWMSHSAQPGFRVVSGHVLVSGQAASLLRENAGFDVTGEAQAVIELPGNGQVKLHPGTHATLRRDGTQVILRLAQGSGEFAVARGENSLRVETLLGTVTATDVRFSIELVEASELSFSTTERPQPRLIVAVTQGWVTIERSGITTTVTAGERREFFGTT